MKPLKDSKCIVSNRDGASRIEWTRKVNSRFRWLFVVFMAFWLGGWSFGEISAAREIVSGTGGPKAFLIFWLCAWTVGGIFGCVMMYQLIRTHASESVTMTTGMLVYDSGTPDILEAWTQLSMGQRRLSPLGLLTKKRKEFQLGAEELATLKVDGEAQNQRLRFDCGAERIEIGSSLSEPEREWLFARIKQRLSL